MFTVGNLMIKSNRLYDGLKYIAQIVLPALGTLYFALSQIWGLPNGEEVVGTIVAFDAFLGVVLGVSNSNYNDSDLKYDGEIDVFEDDMTQSYSLNINDDPYELKNKREVVFKVNPPVDDS